LYDGRFVNPDDLDALTAQAGQSPWPADQLATWLRGFPGPDLEQRMSEHQRRRGELQLLQGLPAGDLKPKGKTFPFRQADRTLKDVPELLEEVDRELTGDHEQFAELDRDSFRAHYQAALELDVADDPPGARAADLLDRYRFHLAVQDLLRTLL